jgi:hypothetical protein
VSCCATLRCLYHDVSDAVTSTSRQRALLSAPSCSTGATPTGQDQTLDQGHLGYYSETPPPPTGETVGLISSPVLLYSSSKQEREERLEKRGERVQEPHRAQHTADYSHSTHSLFLLYLYLRICIHILHLSVTTRITTVTLVLPNTRYTIFTSLPA